MTFIGQSLSLQNSCSSLAAKVSDADNNMKMFMEKASDLEGTYHCNYTRSIIIITTITTTIIITTTIMTFSP
jgi:hypothetical protein